MKALVAYSKDDYRLELEYPTPECGPDDIIIKTEACGVCAGDLKCKHGAAMFWGDDVQPSWVKPPFIPGHEFFGRIVQMGENVTGYELGDRITADQIVPLRQVPCLQGRPLLDVPAPRYAGLSVLQQRRHGRVCPLSQDLRHQPRAR